MSNRTPDRSVKTTKRGTFRAIKRSKTARTIELYSAAYKLALEQIPPLHWRERPDMSLRIHASIRRQLKAGAKNANDIAFKALKETLVPDSS
jgi:hypothetical protein